MAAPPMAVVFTYLPDEDRAYHTLFVQGEGCDDPLTAAVAFREAEEERGDFPGSLWSVTGNEPAQAIRGATILRQLGMTDQLGAGA